ncbi:MAG: hypothetical protein V4486_03410 [Patescibacteria group bacterium]
MFLKVFKNFMKAYKKLFLVALAITILPMSSVQAASMIKTLNGLNTADQTFVNDTNLKIISSGTTHTLGWNGLLAPNRGGLGLDASGFEVGAIPFFNGSVFAQSNNLNWDEVNDVLFIGGLDNGGDAYIGGDLNIQGQITGSAGQLKVKASTVNFSQDGMDLNVLTSTTPNQDGGAVRIVSGEGNNNSNGGNVLFLAGNAGAGTGIGGTMQIGTGSGGIVSGDGGSMQIGTGSGDQYGGNISIAAGAATGTISGGHGGQFILSTGDAYGSANSGDAQIIIGAVHGTGHRGTFSVLSNVSNFSGDNSTTVHLGSASGNPGCIIMGDSDGSGVTYITANDGVLSASSTPPANCN